VVAPRELRQRITEHALAQDLDPRLVEALIRVESAFNARALSHKGAMGLMQLMPGTATELGVENAFDVDQNLRGGTAYLRQLLDRYDGDLPLALAGYNAGPGAVDRYRGVPPYRETTEYVERILAAYGAPVRNAKPKPVPIRYVPGRRVTAASVRPGQSPPGPSRASAEPAAAPLAGRALPGAGR
jgi:soluble lytic murein transglycosylase-like protein